MAYHEVLNPLWLVLGAMAIIYILNLLDFVISLYNFPGQFPLAHFDKFSHYIYDLADVGMIYNQIYRCCKHFF